MHQQRSADPQPSPSPRSIQHDASPRADHGGESKDGSSSGSGGGVSRGGVGGGVGVGVPSALHSYRLSLLRSCDLPSWVHSAALPPALAQRLAQASMFPRAPLLQPPRRTRVREHRSWEVLRQQEAEEKERKAAASGAGVGEGAGAKLQRRAVAGSNAATTASAATTTTPRVHGLADVRFRPEHATPRSSPAAAAATADSLSDSHAATSHTAAAASSTDTAAAAAAAPAASFAASSSNVFPYTSATSSPEFQSAFRRVAAQTQEKLLSKERIEVYTKKPLTTSTATCADTERQSQSGQTAAVPSVWPPVDFTDGSVVIARFEQLKGSGNRVAESGGSILHRSPPRHKPQSNLLSANTSATNLRSNLSANHSSSVSKLPEAFDPALRLAAAAEASSKGYSGGTLGSPTASSTIAGQRQQSLSDRGAAIGSVSPPKQKQKQLVELDATVLPLTSELAPARYVHPAPKMPTDTATVSGGRAGDVSRSASTAALATSPSTLDLVASHLSVAARSPTATRVAHGSDSSDQLLEGVVANGGVWITAASAAAAAAPAGAGSDTAASDTHAGGASAASSSPSRTRPAPPAPPLPPATSPPSLMKLSGIQPATTDRQIRWCFESVGVEVRRVRMQGLYAAVASLDSFESSGGIGGGLGSFGESRLRSNAGGSESCALVEYFPRGMPARRIKRQVYERLCRLQGGEGSAAELALRALTKRAGGLGDSPRFFGLDQSPCVIDRRARLLSKVAADMDVSAKLFMLMTPTPVLNAVTHRVDKQKLAQPVEVRRTRGDGGAGAETKPSASAEPESDISKELSNLFAQGGDAWMDSGEAADASQHPTETAEEADEDELIAASAHAPLPPPFVTISPPSPVSVPALVARRSSSSSSGGGRSHSRKRSSLLMDPSLSAAEAILSISVDSSATLQRALSPLSHQAAAAAAAAAIEANAAAQQQQQGKRDSGPRHSPSPSPSPSSSDLVSPHRALQFSLHRRATADRARDTKQALKSQALEEHAASMGEQRRAAAAAAAASAARDEREFERAAKRVERAANLLSVSGDDDDEDAHLMRDEELPGSSDASNARRQLPLQMHHIAAATRSSPRASRFRVPLSSLVPSLAPSTPLLRSSSGGSGSGGRSSAVGSPRSPAGSPPVSVPGSPGTTVVSIPLSAFVGSGGCDSGSIPSSPVAGASSASSPRFQPRPMTHVNSRKLAEFNAKMDALHSPASTAAQIQQQAVAARKAAVANRARKKC